MDIVRNMQLFVRVVELQSFRLAAEEMGVSFPTASRCIDNLETRLGVKLLDRSTRHMSLTECGARYLENCKVWLENFAQVETAVQGIVDEPHGALLIIFNRG